MQKEQEFQKAKFIFGYQNLSSIPFIIENFGYIDQRSLLFLNKIITIAASNMNKDRDLVNYDIKLKLNVKLMKAEANAGLARYYYNYDDQYCRL